MQRDEVLSGLRTFVANELLDGRDMGLDSHTPLLEWGIINSFELIRLIGFIQSQFNVEIPTDQMVAENFSDLASITDIVIQNREPRTENRG